MKANTPQGLAKFKVLYKLRDKYDTKKIYEPMNFTPDWTYYNQDNGDTFKVRTASQRADGTWTFNINKNTKAKFFVLIALDAEDNTVITWLLPQSITDGKTKISLNQDSYPDSRL